MSGVVQVMVYYNVFEAIGHDTGRYLHTPATFFWSSIIPNPAWTRFFAASLEPPFKTSAPSSSPGTNLNHCEVLP